MKDKEIQLKIKEDRIKENKEKDIQLK